MSVQNNSAAIEFELKLIKDEIGFYLDFMPQFTKQDSAGILIFGIIPYLSLLTLESYDYIKKIFPNYAEKISLKHKEIIRNSRMQMKYFDG
ncbi:hypothetical protein VB620_09000 [Nodularia harveyana UHCC-0300]|uniref:Uncharacterized protein n=1 Tax=Nodularia harveyana UHCC-0300 TaxID=2974287 RepID=A0ABU5UEE0_9CYAN|nr:hypothetical protein [Nodularia harveyana]MEA5581475.1 hypothetical protein [Nodularia harveyana UHCC-0300]